MASASRSDAGEFIALIGQNGSGKTTLAKHLNGLLHAEAGEVRLAGADLRTLPLEQVAREVGYVFQNPDHQLFAATVAEEVAFGPRNFGLDGAALAARVDETLAAVGLADARDEDPFLLAEGRAAASRRRDRAGDGAARADPRRADDRPRLSRSSAACSSSWRDYAPAARR